MLGSHMTADERRKAISRMERTAWRAGFMLMAWATTVAVVAIAWLVALPSIGLLWLVGWI